ncbi:MAG: DsrE family protein [Syntrophotaleaceae bacterium]
MQKIALVAFNGELLCFVHVLLNALDMRERGQEPAIIFEGQAVTLVAQLEKPDNAFHQLYGKARQAGLIRGVCKACSAKLGALEAVQAAGLPLLDEMSGHPSLGELQEQGYTVLTF